jgi:hypothetical protein
MKRFVISFAFIGMMAATAWASTVTYTTASAGTGLSCNGAAGCTQDGTDEVELGTVPGSYLTLTYSTGAGAGIQPPSTIDLGHLTAAVGGGTPSGLSISGLLLTIVITSTPPGSTGTIPGGAITGTISYNGSTGNILFTPNNTTSSFGTLPGVVIGDYLYQVTNPSLSIVPPNSGNPAGQTSIQGAVTQLPEPASLGLMGGSLIGLAVLGRRLLRRAKN